LLVWLNLGLSQCGDRRLHRWDGFDLILRSLCRKIEGSLSVVFCIRRGIARIAGRCILANSHRHHDTTLAHHEVLEILRASHMLLKVARAYQLSAISVFIGNCWRL
jgi:hypothetical protein